MNKTQKIVWTVYLLILFYLFFASTNYSVEEDTFNAYLFFGWIPALILHFVWKDQNERG